VARAGAALLASPTTVRDALKWATRELSLAGVPSPRLDAEVLLAFLLGWNRARLYARPEFVLSEEQRLAFVGLAHRRQRREPVPYIVGRREFYDLDFAVDRRVLIPRPETEVLVERALETARSLQRHHPHLVLADVGTGSAIVAVSLAVHLPNATVYATDSSAEALQVAQLNVARHGGTGRVRLLLGKLLEPLPEPVHIIAANLPYVPTGDLATVAPDVSQYEPLGALDGGADGLESIRTLLAQVPQHLLPGGAVLLEIGADQGAAVVGLVESYLPGARVELYQDYAGLDRVVRIQPCSDDP
jgi:release factor glutamine methyltransferase